MDGTDLEIPKHLYDKYPGAGKKENKDGTYSYGYKVVWIQEVIDRKGVIRGLTFAPINEHDLPLGKRLAEDFDFEVGSTLIVDRGFLSKEWITDLKQDRNIDVVIPLKSNSEITQYVKAKALHNNNWIDHPIRKNQRIVELSTDDLEWKGCPVLKSGVLVHFKTKNKDDRYVAFVSTKVNQSAKQLLSMYDLRAEIEESHRQMKCFQGLEKLPSKKYIQVIFRVMMGVISYNLFNLFLNSKKCETLEDFTLKTHRQKKYEDRNPEMIIYTDTTFAIIRQYEFLRIILLAKDDVRKKYLDLIDQLMAQIHSSA